MIGITKYWKGTGKGTDTHFQWTQKQYRSAIVVSLVTVVAIGALRALKLNAPLLTLLGLCPAKWVTELLQDMNMATDPQEERANNLRGICPVATPFDGGQDEYALVLEQLPNLWETWVDMRVTAINSNRFIQMEKALKKHQRLYSWCLRPALWANITVTGLLAGAFGWQFIQSIRRGLLYKIPEIRMPGQSWASWKEATSSLGLSRGPRTLAGDFFLGTVCSGVATLLLYHPFYRLNNNWVYIRQDYVTSVTQALEKQIKEEVQQPLSPDSTLLHNLDVCGRYLTTLELEQVNGSAFEMIASKLTSITALTLSGDNISDDQLKAALPNLQHLQTLQINHAPNVKGSFWEKVPDAVKVLIFPTLEVLPEKIGSHKYSLVVIHQKITTDGLVFLQTNLHAQCLQACPLPTTDESLQKVAQRQALEDIQCLASNMFLKSSKANNPPPKVDRFVCLKQKKVS